MDKAAGLTTSPKCSLIPFKDVKYIHLNGSGLAMNDPD